MRNILFPFIILGILILGIIKVIFTYLKPLEDYNSSVFAFWIEFNILGILSILTLIFSIKMKKRNQYWILPMLISLFILITVATGYCLILYYNYS